MRAKVQSCFECPLYRSSLDAGEHGPRTDYQYCAHPGFTFVGKLHPTIPSMGLIHNGAYKRLNERGGTLMVAKEGELGSRRHVDCPLSLGPLLLEAQDEEPKEDMAAKEGK